MSYHSEANKRSLRRRPWATCLASARKRAKKTGCKYTLTAAWGRQTYTGYCAITGLPFKNGVGKQGPTPYSLSIDRINPLEGYTPINCRFVLFAVNALKGSGSNYDMILIAKALLTNAE